jgi:hypothetical protein
MKKQSKSGNDRPMDVLNLPRRPDAVGPRLDRVLWLQRAARLLADAWEQTFDPAWQHRHQERTLSPGRDECPDWIKIQEILERQIGPVFEEALCLFGDGIAYQWEAAVDAYAADQDPEAAALAWADIADKAERLAWHEAALVAPKGDAADAPKPSEPGAGPKKKGERPKRATKEVSKGDQALVLLHDHVRRGEAIWTMAKYAQTVGCSVQNLHKGRFRKAYLTAGRAQAGRAENVNGPRDNLSECSTEHGQTGGGRRGAAQRQARIDPNGER